MTPAEVVSDILKAITEKAQVGVNLLDLEKTAETMITLYGAQSANKGYKPKWATVPFPSVICLGVNDIISHAIPVDYVLKDGDLLHIDLGIILNGMCGDAGLTVPIGEISNKDRHLLKYSLGALYEGIKVVKAGIKVTEIGVAIERYVISHGFVVNKVFMGHGIGRTMHEGIQIPHFDILLDKPDFNDIPILVEGDVICIEPMITYKDKFGYQDKDGWTHRTRDGRKSCFFENMIKITSLGAEVLTSHIKEGVNN